MFANPILISNGEDAPETQNAKKVKASEKSPDAMYMGALSVTMVL
jgi:hypothetical protein